MAPADGDAERAEGEKHEPPFPWARYLLVGACRLPDPLMMSSVFPYIFFMVKDFGIARTDEEVGKYAGIISSAYALCQCLTLVRWARISDRYGRKPVLLVGLAASVVASGLFGLSTNLPMAVATRSIAGLMNGNAGVVRSVVAEMLTSAHHEGRAYVIVPVVWGLGLTLGPLIGGALADPARQYPDSWLGRVPFLQRHKFALPNFVIAILSLLIGILAWLYLPETHATLRHARDPGREWGAKLARILSGRWWRQRPPPQAAYHPLEQHERRTPRTPHGPVVSPPISGLLQRDIVLILLCYMLVGFNEVGFDETFPVFASTPIEKNGLGMTSRATGLILGYFGLAVTALQLTLFPVVQRRLGTMKCLRLSLVLFIPSFLLVPLTRVPHGASHATASTTVVLAVIFILRSVASVFSFPALAILVNHATPSWDYVALLGSVSQSFVYLARAAAPLVCGYILSLSLHAGKPFIWITLTVISVLCAALPYVFEDKGPLPMLDDADDVPMRDTRRRQGDAGPGCRDEAR